MWGAVPVVLQAPEAEGGRVEELGWTNGMAAPRWKHVGQAPRTGLGDAALCGPLCLVRSVRTLNGCILFSHLIPFEGMKLLSNSFLLLGKFKDSSENVDRSSSSRRGGKQAACAGSGPGSRGARLLGPGPRCSARTSGVPYASGKVESETRLPRWF